MRNKNNFVFVRGGPKSISFWISVLTFLTDMETNRNILPLSWCIVATAKEQRTETDEQLAVIPTKRSTISAVETIFPRTCLEVRCLRRLLISVSEFTTETEVLLCDLVKRFSTALYIAGNTQASVLTVLSCRPTEISACHVLSWCTVAATTTWK